MGKLLINFYIFYLSSQDRLHSRWLTGGRPPRLRRPFWPACDNAFPSSDNLRVIILNLNLLTGN